MWRRGIPVAVSAILLIMSLPPLALSPPAAAQQTGDLDLAPSSGPPGTQVEVTGYGFPPGIVWLYWSEPRQPLTSVEVSFGDVTFPWTASFTVPNVPNGTYEISAESEHCLAGVEFSCTTGSVTFTVTGSSAPPAPPPDPSPSEGLTLTPSIGPPGERVEIYCDGCVPDYYENLRVEWFESTEGTIGSGRKLVDIPLVDGVAQGSFEVPSPTSTGRHLLLLYGYPYEIHTTVASTYFEVEIPFVCVGGTECNGVPHLGSNPPTLLEEWQDLFLYITEKFAGCILSIAAHHLEFLEAVDLLIGTLESLEAIIEDNPFRAFLSVLPFGSCFLGIVDIIAPGQLDAFDDCLRIADCRERMHQRLTELVRFEAVRSSTDTLSATIAASTAAAQPQQIGQTWLWGPQPITGVVFEYYHGARAAAGAGPAVIDWRAVQYFDKSRMEISDPDGDPTSQWYVTNGLLATELLTGMVQMGDSTFVAYDPANNVRVAGDQDDPDGPTYWTMGRRMTIGSRYDDGQTINVRLDQNANVWTDESLNAYNVAAAELSTATNKRAADVFWDFMQATAAIYDNPYYVTGLPITDAYWANVKVGGVQKDVLIQCFERRCMTYTPSNPDGWQVEMGNIGQHYYMWRYGNPDPVQPDRFSLGGIVYVNRDDDREAGGPGETPIQGAQIEIEGPTSATLYTDERGEFFIKQILPGRYTVTQSLNGTPYWQYNLIINSVFYSYYLRIPMSPEWLGNAARADTAVSEAALTIHSLP